jgi:hypothetical protein
MTHTVNDVTPHTLVVDDHVDDMITIFNISGPMCYADEAGAQTVGAGAVDRLVR